MSATVQGLMVVLAVVGICVIAVDLRFWWWKRQARRAEEQRERDRLLAGIRKREDELGLR